MTKNYIKMFKVLLANGATEYYAILGGYLVYQGTNNFFKRSAKGINEGLVKFEMLSRSMKSISKVLETELGLNVVSISSALYEYDPIY